MATWIISTPLLERTGFIIIAVIFLILLGGERFSALRRRVEPWLRRTWTNGVVALPALVALRLLLIPAVVATAAWAESHRFGFVHWLNLPRAAATIVAFLFLDYTMYGWHWLNHRVPLLWRFHHVHHSDLDLDVTTAFRFHFGEMLFSVAVRALEVLIIGASPGTVLVYELCLEASTQFHHSNLRLPLVLERRLSRFIMTPRAHGIHHSIVDRETNSNYSNLFFFWDRLHGTVCLDVPQNSLVIGVPTHRDPRELTPLKLLVMPFRKQRRSGPTLEDVSELPSPKKPSGNPEGLLP